MRPVVLRAQPDPGDPLINEPSILPDANMIGMIDPAWKDEVVKRAAAAFEPCPNTAESGFKELELNGPAGLLLDDDRTRANLAAADEIADPDFNNASPELTVDREIEYRSVAKPPLSLQPEPDGPDLLRLQRAFATELPARVPWAPFFGARVKYRGSHRLSPLGRHRPKRKLGAIALENRVLGPEGEGPLWAIGTLERTFASTLSNGSSRPQAHETVQLL